MQITAALTLANQHFEQGRITEADRVIASVCAGLPSRFLRNQLRFAVAMQRRAWDRAFVFAAALAGDKKRPGPQPEAWLKLGYLLAEQGEFERAQAAMSHLFALQPDNAEAHYNRAHFLLALGRYDEAWPEFEWRYQMKQAQGIATEDTVALWCGEELAGGTLLIDTEQGYGDVIQHLRYLPLAAQRCGQVVIRSRHDGLGRLFNWMSGQYRVVSSKTTAASVSAQAYCPIGRLPGLFATTPASIPNTVPYLNVDAAQRRKWASRLDALCAPPAGKRAAKPRLGLVWAGNPRNAADAKRSMGGAMLSSLLDLEHLCFIALQVGDKAAQLTDERVLNVAREFRDFGDTAAVLSELDGVITVDTSVAHLAAALALPAWVMLAKVPDWRYIHEGARSRWFPSSIFVQQQTTGDWPGVIQQVRENLLERFPFAD